MLYPEVFVQLEACRWQLSELPWQLFDPEQLTEEQALTIKMNALTEWSSLPAMEMFLRDGGQDADFGAFMSVWYYEEMKHALVLIEYLKRFRPDLVPTETELQRVRFSFDPAPIYETLALHFCGEVRLSQWYRRAADWHSEPLIKHIYATLAKDEARHAGAYCRYMERALIANAEEATNAFLKVASAMTNPRLANAHPTNLHVNKSLFPMDSVQSRLPDPEWMKHWLTAQIKFGERHEDKVINTILNKLSTLLGIELESVEDLRQYRKQRKQRSYTPGPTKVYATAPSEVAISTPANVIKGDFSMYAVANTALQVNCDILSQHLGQFRLEFDADQGVLWVRMAPRGRPCFSVEFMRDIRRCQIAIENTGGKILKDGVLHDLQFVVLASDIPQVFNLGGDLALFSQLVKNQDRDALSRYARQCIDISFHNYTNYNLPVTTISLVQGDALGGGFESALSSSILVAEKSATFGFPEILFNLFPGMGAYTYLGRKIGIKAANDMILSGKTFCGAELHERGIVDVLADDGCGDSVVAEYAHRRQRAGVGFLAAQRARQRFDNVAFQELVDTTDIWVDAALKLRDRDLKMMERLVRKQHQLVAASEERTSAVVAA